MDLMTLAITSFGVAFSGALMPGPLLVSNIAETTRAGLKGGIQVVAGHALLEAVAVALLVAGLGYWLEQDVVLGTVALLGGLGLAFLGWSTVRHPDPGTGAGWEGGGDERWANSTGTAAWTEGKLATRVLSRSPVLSGITASAANPYWLLWWATVGTAYLALASPLGWYGFIVFYLAHISADFLWYGAVSWGLVTGQKRLQSQVTTWTLRVAGTFLLALAIYFMYTGLEMLL